MCAGATCGWGIPPGCWRGIVWDLAFGSLIAPIFSGFWKFVRAILGFALLPAKNFPNLQKFYLHLRKNGLQ
ncbi:MAG: hypothetical protein ACLS4A_02325 [Oscillospiraceae bacterium]